MTYRHFITQKEWDDILMRGSLGDPETLPHCNPDIFHAPHMCPFCDSYYISHPDFHPVYTPGEANGWGGNMAPIIDDEKAEIEEREFFDFAAAMRGADRQVELMREPNSFAPGRMNTPGRRNILQRALDRARGR